MGGSLSGHGSPWEYDRRVPILFWSPQGTGGQERFFAIRTIDIAPTLANVVGVEAPTTVEGRCMDLGLFGAGACPVVAPAASAVERRPSALQRTVSGIARRLGAR